MHPQILWNATGSDLTDLYKARPLSRRSKPIRPHFMSKTKSKQRTHLLSLGLGLILAFGAAPLLGQETEIPEIEMPNLQPEAPDASVSPEVRMDQIRAEFAQINETLQQIQSEAMQDPAVQETEEAYQEALEKEMLAIAPKESEPMVKKRFKLSDRLDAATSGDSQMSQQQLVSLNQRFEKARESVAPIEEAAAAKPDVKAKQDAMLSQIANKMQEINPNFVQLVQQQEALAREFRQIQQQLDG